MLWRVSGRWSICRPPAQLIERLVEPVQPPRTTCRNTSYYTSLATAIVPRAHRQFAELDAPVASLQDRDAYRKEDRCPTLPSAEAASGLELPMKTTDAGSSQSHVHRRFATWKPSASFLTDGPAVCRVAERLADTPDASQIPRLLDAALAAGVHYHKNVYEQLAYYLAKAKRWDLVLSIVARGIREPGYATVRLLNWRGRALLETQQFAQLNALLGDFASYGLKPQRRTFHLILKGNLLNHDIVQAKRTMIEMGGAGIVVDESTYVVIVAAYRGLGSDKFIEEKAYSLLADLDGEGRIRTMNTLFRFHLDKHDLPGALRILKMASNALKPSSSRPEEMKDLIFGFISHSTYTMVADCVTHTLLIEYVSKHEPHHIDHVFRLLKSISSPLDCEVAAALMRMYYRRGSESKALSVLLDACNCHDLRAALCRVFGYNGGLRSSSFTFQGPPTIGLFNSMLQGSLTIHGIRVVPTVLELMQFVRLRPDSATSEIFTNYLKTQRRIRPEVFFRIVQSLVSADFLPTLKQLNGSLSAVVSFGKRLVYKEGWNALSYHAKSRHVASQSIGSRQGDPPPRTGTDLGMVAHNADPVIRATVGPLLDSLENRGIQPDRATYALRMRFDTYTLPPAQASEAAIKTFYRMQERGLHPTIRHYAALVEAHCRANNFDAAYASVEAAAADDVLNEPTSHAKLYTIIISAYARHGEPSLALKVVRKMLRGNLTLDAAVVDAVVGAFFAVKAFRLARSLLLELWPVVAPFPEELRESPLRVLMTRLREIRNRGDLNKRDSTRHSPAETGPTRSQVLRVVEKITAMMSKKRPEHASSQSREGFLRLQRSDGQADSVMEVVTGSSRQIRKTVQPPFSSRRLSVEMRSLPVGGCQQPKGATIRPNGYRRSRKDRVRVNGE